MIATTYLTKKNEPQGKDKVTPNDHERIKTWANSVLGKGPSVIFHDQLSDEFRRAYPWIDFEQVDHYPYSINDSRYLMYRDYLTSHDVKEFYMTDCFDVKINCLPEPSDKLYVQNEDSVWHLNPWSRHLIGRCYGVDKEQWLMGKTIFNAGVWGGQKELVLEMLNLIADELERIKADNKNCNMIVFNKVLYEKFGIERVITGYPLHSKFKGYEVDSKACFIHK